MLVVTRIFHSKRPNPIRTPLPIGGKIESDTPVVYVLRFVVAPYLPHSRPARQTGIIPIFSVSPDCHIKCAIWRSNIIVYFWKTEECQVTLHTATR